MATIREVAKLAGVSVATVSRVLNQKGYVHEDTVKQVRSAIDKLQYKPNAVAKSLFKKSSTLLGLLLPDFTHPLYSELAHAIEQTAFQAGYQVILCQMQEDKDHYIDILMQNNVAGLLVTQEIYDKVHMKVNNIPCVVLESVKADVPSVSCNSYEGAKQAVQLLMEKGCNFLAHIRGPETYKEANDRYEGFLDAVLDEGISYRITGSGEQAIYSFLEKAPYIDGIFAWNDEAGIDVIRAALKHGIQVPEHLQVIGFDGIKQGEILYPSLTTVSQQLFQKGSVAATMLIRRIEGKEIGSFSYVLTTKIIERESTK
ncbi:LacI family DNA-binding transcriptional regulator [Bacillus sp. 165]|uniref:LacI family DNA-binding transcriptional regulator n=1 Tax=Bacillus sp. 165 TaxID=1529117 RepID=UPI001AD9E59A|nr:LacI family DNA-binding transcriptional regulator [Bacillus sp. 165]MBO9129785.1 LacI family DNA-binding transcriptional regulator [Bacillus sp. 165]